MAAVDRSSTVRIPLSKSQQNIYNGVLQDNDPTLYLIGRSYQFHPLELHTLAAAVEATVLGNPVQLCVLESSTPDVDYPDLCPRLSCDDIIRIRSTTAKDLDDPLVSGWTPSLVAKPLVRYAIWVDADGLVSRLDVHTHHILLDGGATGMVEADLGRHLNAHGMSEIPCVSDGLARLAEAHRCEETRIEESHSRLAAAVRLELADEKHRGGFGQPVSDISGMAAKGVLCESVQLSGREFEALVTLSEAEHVPLNVLVSAAAVAVDASLRQGTDSLLVHAVDNRFGDPTLTVATCLVNSVAQSVSFQPFAAVRDVVRALDRGYVRAVRRRWLREEHYRRMYLAINRATHVEALTLNFLREPCASELRPFLDGVPVTTDIGPVESLTVASILDEERRTLTVSIWNRAEASQRSMIGRRIIAALEAMPRMWDRPVATIVDEWLQVSTQGTLCPATEPSAQNPVSPPAWFLDTERTIRAWLRRRRFVEPWIAWLIQSGVEAGDVLVFTDDDTDKSVDLLIASHLCGCGYSVCDSADEIAVRVEAITEHGNGVASHIVDVGNTVLPSDFDDTLNAVIDAWLAKVAHDPGLGAKTAYIMPTSGSTGQPKLVRVTHESLSLFCAAIQPAYGWNSHDVILQCAPLTSDISVEEIFCALFCGADITRSAAMKSGDISRLAQDVAEKCPTIVDLPTAVWHVLGEDNEAAQAFGRSYLRQIVVGGEAIRSKAVDKWIGNTATQSIALVSSYGPTETTVVATYLPLTANGAPLDGGSRGRLGRPILPETVFVAFGEVVIVGDLVSPGYLGVAGGGFGTVMTADGRQRRAFATSDRVVLDEHGSPIFAGRRDALVKISGRRIDTAEVTCQIVADPAVTDVAVESRNGALGVWFQAAATTDDNGDAIARRIRRMLVNLSVPSLFVIETKAIPRKANGKVDSAQLPMFPDPRGLERDTTAGKERAQGLALLWGQHLGRNISAEASLLDEGIGSLDLIKILPETRRYLGRHVTILDLISADTAANLVEYLPTAATWMDTSTATEIDHDFTAMINSPSPPATRRPHTAKQPTIVVLGASGVLGTGFGQAVLDLARARELTAEFVLVTRSKLPETHPWPALAGVDGIRFEYRCPRVSELDEFVRATGATTVVNCIGNTNVVIPYRDLRPANVHTVSAIAHACANHDVRLMHLSTFVVNADVTKPEVTDPRDAPYPYAASKSLAELAVAAYSGCLDFTLARLPRVLGQADQLATSADILIAVADACTALGAHPALTLTEEVTTGQAAATSLLRLLPENSEQKSLGRGITVVRGEPVNYRTFLGQFGPQELDVTEWKHALDQSNWAAENPRRWSVIDAWITLGTILGGRSYSQHVAQYPTVSVDAASVTEVNAVPSSLSALVTRGIARTDPARMVSIGNLTHIGDD